MRKLTNKLDFPTGFQNFSAHKENIWGNINLHHLLVLKNSLTFFHSFLFGDVAWSSKLPT